MTKDQFFKENPGATEVHEVDGQFFLANHLGAARECAQRLGKKVETHSVSKGKAAEAAKLAEAEAAKLAEAEAAKLAEAEAAKLAEAEAAKLAEAEAAKLAKK